MKFRDVRLYTLDGLEMYWPCMKQWFDFCYRAWHPLFLKKQSLVKEFGEIRVILLRFMERLANGVIVLNSDVPISEVFKKIIKFNSVPDGVSLSDNLRHWTYFTAKNINLQMRKMGGTTVLKAHELLPLRLNFAYFWMCGIALWIIYITNNSKGVLSGKVLVVWDVRHTIYDRAAENAGICQKVYMNEWEEISQDIYCFWYGFNGYINLFFYFERICVGSFPLGRF